MTNTKCHINSNDTHDSICGDVHLTIVLNSEGSLGACSPLGLSRAWLAPIILGFSLLETDLFDAPLSLASAGDIGAIEVQI